MAVPGRWALLEGASEISALERGLDFRSPQYRREVFLRFYEFHTRYRNHPGCVYYLIPHLSELFEWGVEERLWFAFVNGNTQNPITSLAIVSAFPSLKGLDQSRLAGWFNGRYQDLAFDTDRRYHKKNFLKSVAKYDAVVRSLGGTQERLFGGLCSSDEEANFRAIWDLASNHFYSFGRLSTFSYLEYLKICGVPLECSDLFLGDRAGSRSHRNGLCKVLGRDDLYWDKSNPGFDGVYSGELVGWLAEEAQSLLAEAKARMPGDLTVSYFTLESAFCTYKSWHKPNRRYPNVYNDMLYNRIKKAEETLPPGLCETFWRARQVEQPEHLLVERCPKDPGLVPEKQNHYLGTGEVIMMDVEWPELANQWNEKHR